MPKKLKLSDLYVTGKELTISDGENSVSVWLQKLNPLQQEKALRRANGARAGVLALKKTPLDSEERMAFQHEFESLQDSREDMVEYLAAEKVGDILQLEEARLAEEDEWKKDGYLQGLNDGWNDTFKMRYAEDPEDVEAKNVFLELKRFADAVEKAVEGERKAVIRDFEEKSDEVLESLIMDRIIEASADLEWLKEYRRCEVWFSVRDPENHKSLYFEDREEVDELSAEVFGEISTAYNDMRVNVVEGKD